MARYEMNIVCVFDTNKPVNKQKDGTKEIIDGCCPSEFGLCSEDCMIDCGSCWFKALEQGVKHGCEFVHVRRLD